MKRSTLVAICLCIALSGSLIAAPFWVSKPYTEWTEKEVEKILGNSPWVKSADIELDFAAIRQGGQGPGRQGMGGPGIGGPGMGGMQAPSAYVMWQSATLGSTTPLLPLFQRNVLWRCSKRLREIWEISSFSVRSMRALWRS